MDIWTIQENLIHDMTSVLATSWLTWVTLIVCCFCNDFWSALNLPVIFVKNRLPLWPSLCMPRATSMDENKPYWFLHSAPQTQVCVSEVGSLWIVEPLVYASFAKSTHVWDWPSQARYQEAANLCHPDPLRRNQCQVSDLSLDLLLIFAIRRQWALHDKLGHHFALWTADTATT